MYVCMCVAVVVAVVAMARQSNLPAQHDLLPRARCEPHSAAQGIKHSCLFSVCSAYLDMKL